MMVPDLIAALVIITNVVVMTLEGMGGRREIIATNYPNRWRHAAIRNEPTARIEYLTDSISNPAVISIRSAASAVSDCGSAPVGTQLWVVGGGVGVELKKKKAPFSLADAPIRRN